MPFLCSMGTNKWVLKQDVCYEKRSFGEDNSYGDIGREHKCKSKGSFDLNVFKTIEKYRNFVKKFDVNNVNILKNNTQNEFTDFFEAYDYLIENAKNGVEIYEGDVINIRGGAFYQRYWKINEIKEII